MVNDNILVPYNNSIADKKYGHRKVKPHRAAIARAG